MKGEVTMAFTIEVWRGNNRVKNTRVGVVFSGFLRGTAHSYTNDQGRAFFEEDTGNGSVYIFGKCEYTGMLKGDVKITL